ncbi:DUF6343 family protein [Streptomyces spiramenti]|uniref:DUF6343 family protein n=1 Tax=Streptomyces spiramenti TaxID=2720606 RepID=UPI001FD84FF8|nr:DUF6343 family protein [Streptomyces spiramenti]
MQDDHRTPDDRAPDRRTPDGRAPHGDEPPADPPHGGRPRADTADPDHHPYRWRNPRTGTEPITARSDLTLRLVLSWVFAPLFLALTVGFAVWWGVTGPGDSPDRGELGLLVVAGAVLTLLAVIDLVVVTRRLRQARARGERATGTASEPMPPQDGSGPRPGGPQQRAARGPGPSRGEGRSRAEGGAGGRRRHGYGH